MAQRVKDEPTTPDEVDQLKAGVAKAQAAQQAVDKIIDEAKPDKPVKEKPGYLPEPMRKPNILQRLNLVMGEVSYIQKEKKQGMRYSIVSHDAVTAKVRPALVKHGVIYWPIQLQMEQNGNRTEVRMTVRFASIDDPEDFIEVETAGYGIDDQDKGPGKAISYSVKYALLKALGLESGDEPDEDQETTHKSAVMEAIKLALGLVTDEEGLLQVAADIKTNSAKLSQTELLQLRQLYAAKQKELASNHGDPGRQ